MSCCTVRFPIPSSWRLTRPRGLFERASSASSRHCTARRDVGHVRILAHGGDSGALGVPLEDMGANWEDPRLWFAPRELTLAVPLFAKSRPAVVLAGGW